MPYLSLESSQLVPGISPVSIYYRDEGNGPPLLFLHGGWGYEAYPFNRQLAAFHNQYRNLIPDRSGYGRSPRLVTELPSDFHYRAASETQSFMDSLNIKRAFFWGHSDGAVIGAKDGHEGLAKAQQTHPALILMDLAMPELDGIEALRTMRREPALSLTPIFVMSAYLTKEVRLDALAAGCDQVFAKPLDLDAILIEITETLAFDLSYAR